MLRIWNGVFAESWLSGDNFQYRFHSNDWRRVTHMYESVNYVAVVSDNGRSTPSHYLEQCWFIVNWIRGKIFGVWFRNAMVFMNMNLKISSAKWGPFCVELNVLMYTGLRSLCVWGKFATYWVHGLECTTVASVVKHIWKVELSWNYVYIFYIKMTS